MGAQTYEAAQEYIKNNWKIIPLQHGSKVPAVASVPEYRERFPTDSELKKWFLYSNLNIAILTGPASGLFVIDVDDKGKIDEYMSKYPTNLISRTPRGGRHLFYHQNGEDVTVSVGVLDDHVDTRGDGGYVVAPPSRVFYDDPQLENLPPYVWQERGEPANLPPDIIEKLRHKRELDIRQAAEQEDGRELFVRVTTQGFSPGKHNLEVKDIARYLFRMGMREGEIVQLIRKFNEADPTPLPDNEMLATIRSGLGYEKQRKTEEVVSAGTEKRWKLSDTVMELR